MVSILREFTSLNFIDSNFFGNRTSLHLPFHIALTLLLEAANQFIVWARVLESINAALEKIIKAANYEISEDPTSQEVSDTLKGVVEPFLQKYTPPDPVEAYESVKEILGHIADIPNSFWSDPDKETKEHFENDTAELINTMINAVYNAFEIKPPEDEDKGTTTKSEYMQSEAVVAIARRFILVVCCHFCSTTITSVCLGNS